MGPRTRAPRGLVVPVALTLISAGRADAAPARDAETGWVWTATTTEILMAGGLTARLTLGDPEDRKFDTGTTLVLTLVPLAIGGAVGYAAYRRGWEPAIPRAITGALWSGGAAFALGALLDGYRTGDAFHVGALAIGLGVAGAAGGALTGALAVHDQTEDWGWYAVPHAAALGGLLVCAVALPVASLSGRSDRSVMRLGGWALIGATVLGLGVGYTLALTRSETEPSGEPASTGRSASADATGTVIQPLFSGTF